MSNKKNFRFFVSLIFWGTSLLGIYWILLKITGHSPTLDQVTLVIVGGMFVHQFSMAQDIGYLKSEVKSIRRTLAALTRDFKKHLENHK